MPGSRDLQRQNRLGRLDCEGATSREGEGGGAGAAGQGNPGDGARGKRASVRITRDSRRRLQWQSGLASSGSNDVAARLQEIPLHREWDGIPRLISTTRCWMASPSVTAAPGSYPG